MIIDLFAGPGGWDEGLRLLGRDDLVGVELDKDAAATAQAAGHDRIVADITELDPAIWASSYVEGIIASPPCQTFSAAGKSVGVASLDDLAEALSYVAQGEGTLRAAELADLDLDDPRSYLILEPLRFIRELKPLWVAMEEVPAVLPVWQAYARILKELGYSAWAGILNSADYGLPQARKRAILVASRTRPVIMPTPTHHRFELWTLYGVRPRWVTMAEGLDWSGKDARTAARAAPGEYAFPSWCFTRPATTIVRSFCPDVIAAPGYRQAGDPSRQNAVGSVRISPRDMCRLQGIRVDYPFKGSESKRLSLIGAILPPPWAAAILGPLLEEAPEIVCTACGNDLATMGYPYCTECLEREVENDE